MSSPNNYCGPWEFSLSFEGGPFSDSVEFKFSGPLPVCLSAVCEELKSNTGGAFLSWPTGSGSGGFYINAGQTLEEAIDVCRAELFDPDTVFNDPAEEQAARLHVAAIAAVLFP